LKIRFWQKTYILTLLLFLVCLYTGVFSLAYYTYGKSVENAESLCGSEYGYISRSFERDFNAMTSGSDKSSPSLLMESYGNHYKSERILLAFRKEDNIIYSSFDGTPETSGSGKIREAEINGSRHIMIVSEICSGEYTLIYAKDASTLDNEFRRLMITYSAVAAFVSAVLAVSLLFVLKKLSVPLEKLQKTTEKISSGDMTVTADESGKDEFSELAKSFNIMVSTVKDQMAELEKDAERKQLLVDNMAHEMRTPLTSIRGYAEYIERAAVPDEEKSDAARRIVSETDRLKRISEKILDISFIRENKINREPVDISIILRDTAGRLEQKAKERGVFLTVSEGECTAYGDETLLSMLFYNLTDNAIKACREGGKVVLSCEGMTASVADNGKGMTKEQLSHITEPFYRTDRSRSRAEGGAGLGLSLCDRIIKAHGAEMIFTSEYGKGTEIKIIFSSSETSPT